MFVESLLWSRIRALLERTCPGSVGNDGQAECERGRGANICPLLGVTSNPVTVTT